MYETIRIVEKLKPKYVIWENVKNVISKKHKHNFDNYINRMNELGYTSYYQVLNAKDYGIPQNRERVFTISTRKDLNIEYSFPNKEILNKNLQELLESNVEEKYFLSEKGIKYVLKRAGGYVQLIDNNTEIAHCPVTAKGNTNWTGNFVKFEFPPKEELKLRLKDILEEQVDEKYYLSEKMINFFYKNEQVQKEKGNGFRFNVSDGNVVAKAVTTRAGCRMDDNFIKIKNNTKKGYDEAVEGDSINLSYPESKTRRGRVGHGVAQTLQCNDSMGVVIEGIKVIGNYMPSGHDASRIVDSDGLAPTVKENHGTVTAVVEKQIEFKNDNCSHALRVSVIPVTAITCNDKRLKKLVENTNFIEGQVMNLDTYNQTTNKEISQCLTEPHHNSQRLFDGLRIRKLTPKECWRLMGFDDEDFNKAEKVNSNTQLYKQARKLDLCTSVRKNIRKFIKYGGVI